VHQSSRSSEIAPWKKRSGHVRRLCCERSPSLNVHPRPNAVATVDIVQGRETIRLDMSTPVHLAATRCTRRHRRCNYSVPLHDSLLITDTMTGVLSSEGHDCVPSILDTDAVVARQHDMTHPAEFMTSSARVENQKYPSSSLRAQSPVT